MHPTPEAEKVLLFPSCDPIISNHYLVLLLMFEITAVQLEGDSNGSSPACKFTEHASNAVHGSVAEHEFDLDW